VADESKSPSQGQDEHASDNDPMLCAHLNHNDQGDRHLP